MKYLFLALFTCLSFLLLAQKTTPLGRDFNATPLKTSATSTAYNIEWIGIQETDLPATKKMKYVTFKGAIHNLPTSKLPFFEIKERLNNNFSANNAQLINVTYTPLTPAEKNILEGTSFLSLSDVINVSTVYFRKESYAVFSFTPIVKDANGQLQKITAFDLDYTTAVNKNATIHSQTYAETSVLSFGDWFKIGVVKDGIHKITYAQLQEIGINTQGLNPTNIRIYGNGGGLLTTLNSAPKIDDLAENAIVVVGEEDGVFNGEDYILFYGQGPHQWEKNGSEFNHVLNIYSDTTYYFITTSLGKGKRLATVNSESNPTQTITTFDAYAFHEKDNINIIKTGQNWLGEQFGVVNTHQIGFNMPNLNPSFPIKVKTRISGRTINGSSTYTISCLGVSDQINDVSVEDSYELAYTSEIESKLETFSANANFEVEVTLSNKGNSSAMGWLDFIEINAIRNLKQVGSQLHFRSVASIGTGVVSKFELSEANSLITVWDITNPITPMQQQTGYSGNKITFSRKTDSLLHFISFTGTSFEVAVPFGKVENQDLHALKSQFPTYIIVTHSKFLEQAEELAQFHRDKEGMNSIVVTTQQVYNEFSSGAQDLMGIRSFVKMFYDEAPTPADIPKYLLLFGDGSYDFKDYISGNSNYVPTYQSKNSNNPSYSYATDDFFGLLDDAESDLKTEKIDIGIGRLTVSTVEQAQDMVAKIKHYYTKETMRAWRNYLVFVADDGDSSLHAMQTEQMADLADTVNKKFNIEKIYLDAFPQVAGAGGERSPDAKNAIDRNVEKGALLITYTGHGGELGWTQERILEVAQINKWSNYDNLLLFLTATCEFSRYDDPQRTSAGELALLNKRGGAIALLTTTRLVYSNSNLNLVTNFFNYGYSQLETGTVTLGDLTLQTKKNATTNQNSRKFNLLGDPATRLAYPKYNVLTTFVSDTLKALSKITVKGIVTDANNTQLETFDGIVYPIIFDKEKKVKTLNTDGKSAFTMKVRNNILFRGKASVKKGAFEFTFVVPKDINPDFGIGRISYYVSNDSEDGSGYDESIIIGGYDEGAESDKVAPEVDLYMNNESFVFGGLTDENPQLFATIFDENGINTSGNGVGHDITAILDEATSEAIVLNDYYESNLDDYKSGKIKYPFEQLKPGLHTLRLKVWDVYNNSGEGITEFVVAESAELALDHVLNYPNPFTTNTAFYFEHNQPGVGIDARIEIFTISGKLIKTLDHYSASNSYRIGPIYWDGRDQFGDVIGKGVYVYRLKVTNRAGEYVDKFEKLVILK